MSYLSRAEEIIGYSFRDRRLLNRALTHSSRANESSGRPGDGNERLEFLGDAVLELVMSEYLYERLPESPEGELIKTRSYIVCESSLAGICKGIGLNELLMLGKGAAQSGSAKRDSIAADLMEAVIGAVYLDGGQEAARDLIFRLLGTSADEAVSGRQIKDPKSKLQELIQAGGGEDIRYEITGESGPDHNKTFEAAVYVAGEEYGRGSGPSKQTAQACAARAALARLGIEG